MNGMEKRKGYQQGVDIRLITRMELCLSRGKGKFPLDCFLPAEYQAVANTNKVIKHSLIPAQ